MFSAFPFSGCFCEDFENKYAYLQVERGNPKVYAISKTITIMLVAELTMMFGVMLYVSLLHLRLPWFDASYISWLSYDSLNIELPDGYLYFLPIINWGRYREDNGKLMMPVSVRLNHAIADGYLVANVFRLLEKEILDFVI